jgi:hypothetical protein
MTLFLENLKKEYEKIKKRNPGLIVALTITIPA